MQVAGIEINLKDVMEQARNRTRAEWQFSITRTDDAKFCVERTMEGEVWKLILDKVKDSAYESAGDIAAKVVAELIHSGVDKDNIRFRNGKYNVRLKNLRYRISRDEHGYFAWPIGCYRPNTACRLSGKDFAKFILEFDALVPELDNAVTDIITECLAEQERIKQDQIAEDIARTAAESILEKYLKPLGIKYIFNVYGDMVNAQLVIHKEAEFCLTLKELAEKMEDTEALLSEFKDVEPKEHSPFDEQLIY